MPRLSAEIRNNIISLVHKKKSLNEIVKITQESKTTIYYYMRNILGKKHKPIHLILDDQELIGEVIGLFAGDGYYACNKKRWDYRIKIYFNAKEIKLIHHYRNSFYRLTGKHPGIINSGPVTIMQLSSKEFCNFILSYLQFGSKKVKTVELKDKKYYADRLFMKGFLRGLVDSDGYVRKGRKEIYYGSISWRLFQDFLAGLNLFKFDYKTYLQKSQYSDFHKVRLKGVDVDNFVKLIKPIKALH